MSDEKLPPEGYEMGPGWRVLGETSLVCTKSNIKPSLPPNWCGWVAKYAQKMAAASCALHAEPMGAIVRKAEVRPDAGDVQVIVDTSTWRGVAGVSEPVRKAEVPTCEPWRGKRTRARMHCLACGGPCDGPCEKGDKQFAAEQPSGNTVGLPETEENPIKMLSRLIEKAGLEPCFIPPPGSDTECRCTWPEGYPGMPKLSADCPIPQHKRLATRGRAEAPAAPVAEPTPAVAWKCRALGCSPKDGFTCSRLGCVDEMWRLRVEKCDARIAALEAELAEASAATQLAREAVEYVVADSNRQAAAAVQAERERAAATLDEYLAGRITLAEARERIGDGTPAP